ncbi:GT2D2 protein, partial [Acromyrmex insinuator]
SAFRSYQPSVIKKYNLHRHYNIKHLIAVESFGNSITPVEASSIPLSDKTVKSRIDDIASSLKKFLSYRKFQNFLGEHNAIYTDVPLCCKIRWDSAQENLALTDMTNHLNILNLKLQKTNKTNSELVSHIDFFYRKLTLFKNHLENNNLHFFRFCQILSKEHGKKCNFKKFNIIESLINQFNARFNDFKTLKQDLILFENSLAVQIEKQSLKRISERTLRFAM